MHHLNFSLGSTAFGAVVLGALVLAKMTEQEQQWCMSQSDCVACSYRGYGLSQGSPTEKGLKQDADASLEYLLQRNDVNHKKVCLCTA